MEQLDREGREALLINVREVERVDDPAALAVVEIVRTPVKAGILGHNLSAYFIAEHMNAQEGIPIFERGIEAVGYFSRELTEGKRPGGERRRFERIRVAVPVEIEVDDQGEAFLFEGAVTDLSQGGLYAEFLETRTAELAHRKLDPFDLRLVHLRLNLGSKKALEVEGKALRGGAGEKGVAVEFYNLNREGEEQIRDFLNAEGYGERGRKK